MFNWDAAAQHLTEEVDDDQSEREVILVVDDEETNRVLLKGILASDYRIVTACDGDDALEKLGAENFSAIVCDHRMPGMTGVEFFTELQ
ncbi:MAG: response regulator, partial [Myxococcota bacterium]|nr:response regulator [Myxococcota bacterium]